MYKSKIQKESKVNVTANKDDYMRQYRQKNSTYFKNYEKCKYYKNKYGLTQAFIDEYGDNSGDIFKLYLQTKALVEKKPELKECILRELFKIGVLAEPAILAT